MMFIQSEDATIVLQGKAANAKNGVNKILG